MLRIKYSGQSTRWSMTLHPTSHELKQEILTQGRALGFDLVGISSRLIPVHFDAYERWINQGMAGEMSHLRQKAVLRCDLRTLLDDARSIIVVAANYSAPETPDKMRRDPSCGIIASYAGGKDYHPWMLSRLEKLAEKIREVAPELRFCVYVDTGPVLERDFAEQAGLGFIGKNALLIHPLRGSFFFLGVLITNLELPTTGSAMRISCGNCARCLKACPTGALIAPYTLDARRCISYLTIEHKGAFPRELRPLIGNRIFGCDECQLVCPWNQKFARPTGVSAFQTSPELLALSLESLARLTDKEFKARFAGTAISRAKRGDLLRNVAVALGNWGAEDAMAPLQTLMEDREPLVRTHAAWALGRLGDIGRNALEKRKRREIDGQVLCEIDAALKGE
ncbi:MAG: tRNA epoxyqueuosine(34) reductase QueG [bacterium]